MITKTTKSLASPLILLALAGGLNDLTAAVWVVDRDPANQAADFESLPEALEAAQPADTIYVMPSGTRYGLESITKSVTIVGSGYGKETSFPKAANVDSKLGSFSITGNDVFLTGLVFEGSVSVNAPSKGITFFRNRFSAVEFRMSVAGAAPVGAMVSNLHVINNYFQGSFIRSERPLSSLIFANNIVNGEYMLLNGDLGDGDFFNNILMVARENNFSYGSVGLNIQFSGRMFNNIISSRIGGGAVTFKVGDPLARFNNFVRTDLDSFASSFPTASNPRFESLNDIIVNQGAWGEPYVLTSDSPAKGAGLNGEDIGIYGGIHAWNPTLQPPLPIISRIEAPRVVGAGEGLKVTVEVQSNN